MGDFMSFLLTCKGEFSQVIHKSRLHPSINTKVSIGFFSHFDKQSLSLYLCLVFKFNAG